MKTGLLPDSVENTLTRAHGKTEVVSLLQKLKELTLEIPPDVSNADMVEIRCACQKIDGVLEQWIDTEDDENVQDAQAMDAMLVDNKGSTNDFFPFIPVTHIV